MPILQWLNREETLAAAHKTVYRMLEEDPNYSYGDPDTRNVIIQGDNLEALMSLLPYYARHNPPRTPSNYWAEFYTLYGGSKAKANVCF